MRTAKFVRMREVAIRRQGERAGVGLVDGAWSHPSAMVGIDSPSPTLYGVGPDRHRTPADEAASESGWKSLLNDDYANLIKVLARGRS